MVLVCSFNCLCAFVVITRLFAVLWVCGFGCVWVCGFGLCGLFFVSFVFPLVGLGLMMVDCFGFVCLVFWVWWV